MRKLTLFLFLIFIGFSTFALNVDRVEPLFWWAGMKCPNLQLMVHGTDIATSEISLDYPGVRIASVAHQENPNYVFINLVISPDARPGTFRILFRKGKKDQASYNYELKNREPNSANRKGFDDSDVIYLITPDRFANGNPNNDNMPGMLDQANRSDKDGRHGGDIQGIEDHLDYISGMGFTSVWITPLLENNMPRTSYHGYAITDLYKVDPRFGTNDDYRKLAQELHQRGMKVMMDMVFNHIGSSHWWMSDMPSPDWVNDYPDFKYSSHKHVTVEDPHASQADKDRMSDGWFDKTMPDLNQRNPFLATYLIQNSIWWTEYLGLNGIRMDTYPYPDKYMMADWTKRMLEEYPNFYIVGEEWSLNDAIVAYWQKDHKNQDGYVSYLPGLMDFPLNNAVVQSLNAPETWGSWTSLYEELANDFEYAHPDQLVIFPDNHDMQRFYTQLGNNFDLWKLGMVYYATTRGIPQIYYGTEILTISPEPKRDGVIRSDFPGGWAGDQVNAFTGAGLSAQQKEAQDFTRKILNWRKKSELVHSGKLMHFVPEDGIYVYFRYSDNGKLMVVLNRNKEEKTLDTARFSEIMKNCTSGHEVISGKHISDLKSLNVPSMAAMIIELK